MIATRTRRAAILIAALASTSAVRSAHADPDPPPVRRPQVHLDALFTYSIGAQSALGGELLGTVAWPVWQTSRATGTIDVGLLVGYQAEPWSLAPWINPAEASGSNHHLRLLPSIGHTFRFGAAQKVSLGLHVYGGMVYWNSTGRVTYAAENVAGSASVGRAVVDLGAFLRFTYRPHPVVGLALYLGGPFYGVTSSYVVDLFTVGLGLTFRLR